MNGILLLDKPLHLSSNAALQAVRRLFNRVKAGHTGSLDPLATGMLPICLGEATKFSQFILDQDKTYVATACLGITTDTGDTEGKVLETSSFAHCSEAKLLAVLDAFLGEHQQTPPMYSALKQQGVPLYKLARQGKEVSRASRLVKIHELTLLAYQPGSFQIQVSCSKGTYIRTLVEDIALKLGTGAHLTALRRLSTAGFTNEPMYTLDALSEMTIEARAACVLPMQRAVSMYPFLQVDEEQALALFQGKVVPFSSAEVEPGLKGVFNQADEFLGMVELAKEGALRVKRLVSQNRLGLGPT